MVSFWDGLANFVDRNLLDKIIFGFIKIIFFFIIARIVINISNRVIHRLLRMHKRFDARRRDTLQSLFENIVRYTVYFLLIVEVLSTCNVNVAALLAGAGIVGLAVGFGAQGLIKDMLTGLFILFEDQYGVGDTVQINGFRGTVRSIGLRLTRVQAWTGEIEVIPNGQIATITNYSRTNSIAVIDIRVSYETNLKQAMGYIEQVMNELKESEDSIVGDVSVVGVQAIRDFDVVLRATAECLSMTHYGIQRKAQARIKEVFDEHGIEIPVPQQSISFFQKKS